MASQDSKLHETESGHVYTVGDAELYKALYLQEKLVRQRLELETVRARMLAMVDDVKFAQSQFDSFIQSEFAASVDRSVYVFPSEFTLQEDTRDIPLTVR